ncbi:cytochrome c [Akkermansiaceae bacterium]|nr:cytochrome c [bacterium]MDA7892256.1 cytochrome c [Akkermansiaceae bacterium]MDA7896132.1 cytochrome c [bacterium]MDA7934619.1 cytochrome c [Akkermansiaceae bacterium]MDB4465362.1 cytochrome c [Akkermansiaceae bacterium]
MRALLLTLFGITLASADPLTFDTTPLGEKNRPIILRTYVPDPGLDPAVFPNHGKASKSPKYSPNSGRDTKGEYGMLKVIPAAIAVNHGPALSYVWDTTECRLLYAWQGGFLDLYPYWGEKNRGGRRSFDYGARLVGNLFYLAKPIKRERPTFIGYDLSDKGVPTFRYQLGDKEYTEKIIPSDKQYSFISYLDEDKLEYKGDLISKHQGFDRNLKIKSATAKAGEQVFGAYGCIACHSTDGSKGHGPSLRGLAGSTRDIEGGESILADAAYLTESIKVPNAKTAKGFPPGYMPPYQLKDKEIESLVLYIQSLAK